MADPLSLQITNPQSQGSGTTAYFGGTPFGSLRSAPYEPRYAELARNGRLFTASITVAQAIAPLQVLPTTVAGFYLHNADTSNSVYLLPLRVGVALASGTADTGISLVGWVTPSATVSPISANGTGCLVQGTRGGGSSSAFFGVSQTVPVGGAPITIATVANAASTTPGVGATGDCEGCFLIRPSYGFCLHGLSGAGTTAKLIVNILWAELTYTSLPS